MTAPDDGADGGSKDGTEPPVSLRRTFGTQRGPFGPG